MTLTLRYMTLTDIPQVVNIDRWSFSTPWSARTYAYEITESAHSHMLVVEEATGETPVRGWWRNLPLLQSLNPAPTASSRIVSYGGLWRVTEEAHISTIASHPDFRGKGYGELALAAMLQRSVRLNAGYVVLEVRVSNIRAQNLYVKYGFSIYTTRQRYYRDNGEDAYEMRLTLTSPVRTMIETRFQALLRQHHFVDQYTRTPAPDAAD